ncbi:helix-turn-helix domain-containing protein [Flavobacterium sp. J27]|uniref:helix-turn-helix domain-containing protein n=1 Tax=Flavobacterium sp. J27 TaxID=2060419 RepID=UPI0010318265|nr:helix-turn-helix transcriptional regulator [Flavobacterium sp. J27]
MTYFGTNLKKIRQIKGLSQQAFAELIDLNRGVISSYEEGRAEPKIETLLRIANYFGISTDDIISKPLTVNQLANFTLIEDSISSFQNDSGFEIQELTEKGDTKNIELQKIFANFDFVFFVNEDLARKSHYLNATVLFLKEVIQAEESHNGFLQFPKGKAVFSTTFTPTEKNYAVIGVLGSAFLAEQKSLVSRIELLEKKVFGN